MVGNHEESHGGYLVGSLVGSLVSSHEGCFLLS